MSKKMRPHKRNASHPTWLDQQLGDPEFQQLFNAESQRLANQQQAPTFIGVLAHPSNIYKRF